MSVKPVKSNHFWHVKPFSLVDITNLFLEHTAPILGSKSTPLALCS
jgi:hypothetical protein